MKIAFCIKEDNLESKLDDRFGRAEYFMIYNNETGEKNIVENPAKNDSGGAGGRAVRFIYQNEAELLIAPELGPKALEALKAFNLKAYAQGDSKDVESAIKNYKDGKLAEIIVAGEEKKGLYRA